MKRKRLVSTLGIAALGLGGLIAVPNTRANDWTNPGLGDWNNAANWNGGIPAGGTIGTIANGGTAVVSTTVPTLNEAQVGNNGVAGNLLITNGGTLTINNWLVVGRNGDAGNTPLSTLTISSNGVLNKAGDGFLLGDSANCKGQMFVKDNGFVHITGGWNGIGNGTGEGWLTLQDNAVYTLDAQDWNIGDYGSSRGHAYIKGNATLNCSRFFVGKNGASVGALWQSGGAIVGVGGNANEWTLGGDASDAVNAFGFYNLSGGTFNNPFNFQVGRYGKGVVYQSGGTLTLGSWASIGRNPTAIGILYVTGGQLIHTSTGTSLMVGENGSRGELTLAGSGSVTCSRTFAIGNGGTGYVNLNGGTLRVPQIDRWGATASGYLSFNGGRLQATTDQAAFLGNLTEACVYAGNAIFDTAGFDVTAAQPLVAPYGDGVQSIPVADGGAGYMAPPIVQIDGSGAGSGAMAVAQIDPAAGTVTNIVVTCSGYGYGSIPNVTFIGGGPSAAATLGTVTLAPVTSGGLVKNGTGTLTLSGANNYTGATVVNAGALSVATDATGAGSYTVADAAALGVKVNAAYGQLGIASLTLASSTAASLNFDLGGFGNPAAVPLNVYGNLAVHGTNTVNIAAAVLQVGQFPLVQYDSKSGSGSFVLGTLPAGVEATLVDNTGAKTIDLKVNSVGLPRWDGQVAGGVWDIKTTPNWVEQSTGLPTTFNDGAPVLFTDDALGTTTVDLVATVKPLSVTVTNVLLPYTIVGVGKISGATGLLKQGTNTLTIANTGLNDYIGRTVISGGTLAVTNLANGGSPSALGKSSANATNLVLSGGTLRYAGTPVSIDRGYTVQGAIGVIDAQSDLTLSGRPVAGPDGGLRKTGAAKLTYTGGGINELSGGGWPGFNVALGTVVFDGSAGAQTNHSHNDCWIGGGVDGNCALVLTNTTLNEDNWVVVARGNGTVGNTSSLTLYDSVLRSGAFSMGFDGGISGNLAQQFTTLNGTSAITNNGDMNLGESGGSSSSMQLNGSSALYSGGRIMVGWHNNATGSVTLANSSKLVINAWLSVGNEGGIGTFTMKNDSSCWVRLDMNVTDVDAGDATLTMQDNAQMTAGALFVAKGAGSTGTATIKDNVRITANNLYVANATGANGIVNQTGGTVTTAGNEFQIGARSAGTYNMSGGVVNSDANWTSIGRYTGSVGELNLSGGVFNHNDAGRIVQVGEEGLGTLNLSGTGILNAAGDRLQIASAVGSAGYVNLNGGTLVARRIASGAGSSTFTFNGGTLRAAPNAHADFMSGLTLATVVAGGAVIDTSTNNIAIVQDLVGDGSGGGLTKLGTGGLALMGVNTYNGLTLVSTGTLGGNGTIAGPVTVSAGAGLAPGTSIGTLTINNPLTLAAGSTTTMDLNKTLGTNDMVAGLATVSYGGTLVLKNLAGQLAVGDTFTLFNTGVRTGAFTNYVSDTPGQVVTWNTDKLQLDGTVKVLTAVALPVKLTSVVIGGNLNLSWPLSQIGWELQTQANPLTVGLSTNWSAVAGSTATNQMSFPINPASGSTFFRLLFP